MNGLLLRREGEIARAAVRRAVRHPTRRTLWTVVAALAATAVIVDVATSERAARNLGSWTPSPWQIVAVTLGILAIAALAGRRTALTYGVRPADATWWRYAGVGHDAGRRATTVLLAARTTCVVTAVAVPLGVLFASADTGRAAIVVVMALTAIALAPLIVFASSATAMTPEDTPSHGRGATAITPEGSPSHGRGATAITPEGSPSHGRGATTSPPRGRGATTSPPRGRGATARSPHGRARVVIANATWIPRGVVAARWLVARRRGEQMVPVLQLVVGVVAGFVAPLAAARAGGQVTALVVVAGGFALLLDGALRRTIAPATLLTPWWRAAFGTSPRAIVVWALADASAAAAFAAGMSLALGAALGSPLYGIAALPLVALVPVALRLTALAVDAFFPGDRRGPGALARVGAVAAVTVLTVVIALGAGKAAGLGAALAAATAIAAIDTLAAASAASARLAAESDTAAPAGPVSA